MGTDFKKDPVFYNSYIVDGSFFNVRETKEAKPLKDMYQHYFSRSAIQRLEGLIHEKTNQFLSALEDAAKSSRPVDLTLGYKCLTADVVMGYCYQKTFGALDAPDFRCQLLLDLEELFRGAPLAWYFPEFVNTLSRLLAKVPRSLIERWMKPMAATFEVQKVYLLRNVRIFRGLADIWRQGCKERIMALQAEPINSMTPTVFRTALHPDDVKKQRPLDLKSMSADALLFFAAGYSCTSSN